MAISSADPAVQTYYDEAYVDYRLVWANRNNYAMHFGYYEDGIRSHSEALNNANAVLSDLAQIGAGDRVLDAGCGVGGTSRWIAKNRGAKVVGITPVSSQVDQARALCLAEGVTGASFEVLDYTATGMPAASFHAVLALESLCHARDKRAFYREMHRLLKRGGRLVVAEYTRSRRPLAPEEERVMRSWMDGWAIPDIATARDHEMWARESGFDAVHHRDASFYTQRSLRRLYLLTLAARPIDFVLHRILGLRTATQSGNVRASRDQWLSFRAGFWYYGLLTARRP